MTGVVYVMDRPELHRLVTEKASYIEGRETRTCPGDSTEQHVLSG
jgi:hypothetical protein